MIHALAYVSAAVDSPKEEDILAILKKAHDFNTKNNITGLLLYNNKGTFLQLLEGEIELINALYRKIADDPRHTRLHKIFDVEIEERGFKNWSMGFRFINDEKLANISGLSDFMNTSEALSEIINHPNDLYKIFDHFKGEVTEVELF